ncbi:unnamed protein product [Amoebophrya sp. A25]|nr:unnamed protein product [Amoebophrya sp. A25]|eukprot:GSA25T00013079001.1
MSDIVSTAVSALFDPDTGMEAPFVDDFRQRQDPHVSCGKLPTWADLAKEVEHEARNSQVPIGVDEVENPFSVDVRPCKRIKLYMGDICSLDAQGLCFDVSYAFPPAESPRSSPKHYVPPQNNQYQQSGGPFLYSNDALTGDVTSTACPSSASSSASYGHQDDLSGYWGSTVPSTGSYHVGGSSSSTAPASALSRGGSGFLVNGGSAEAFRAPPPSGGADANGGGPQYFNIGEDDAASTIACDVTANYSDIEIGGADA